MASAAHLKALLKSHIDGDQSHFVSVFMQIAAHEARLGHGKLARELRAMIDDARNQQHPLAASAVANQYRDLASLLEASQPKARLGEIILGEQLANQIEHIIREQRHTSQIIEHGLTPRCRLLMVGPPGTGKTFTASILAGELGLPLLRVRLDGLITKFMGETAAKLRQIFDAIGKTRGVYFFDEFDAIGSQRGLANDVGEVRRILNSFLLMIEQSNSHSLVLAATNHCGLLDPALFRRFDDVLHYDLPNFSQIINLLKIRLAGISTEQTRWESLAETAKGLNHADIVRAANEALKDKLINERDKIAESVIRRMLEERQSIASRMNGTPTK